MKKGYKKLGICLLLHLFLVGSFTFSALAEGKYSMAHSRYGFSGLGLSSEQTTKLESLRDNFRKETLDLRRNVAQKRSELRALWLSSSPEREKILAKEKEIADLMMGLREKQVDLRLERGKILTPEQKDKIFSQRGPLARKRYSGRCYHPQMMGHFDQRHRQMMRR